jgi:hypothetical protein
MKKEKLSKLDQAILACQETLECIKRQKSELNKLNNPTDETSEDKWRVDAAIDAVLERSK